jgi:endothelin-converting enzyme/putative endopeptidase
LDVSREQNKTIEKLNKITIKIGYPDQWKDYSKLEIKSVAEGGSYFENVKKSFEMEFSKT